MMNCCTFLLGSGAGEGVLTVALTAAACPNHDEIAAKNYYCQILVVALFYQLLVCYVGIVSLTIMCY